MKNTQKGFLAPFFIILIVIALGLGIYAAAHHAKSASSASSTVSADTSATAGWKSYTNAKAGYSLMYPADMTISENSAGAVSFNGSTASSTAFTLAISATTTSYTAPSDILTSLEINPENDTHAKFSDFKQIALGSNTFYSHRSELFEGVLSVHYYLIAASRVYFAALTSQEVDWTNPNFNDDADAGNIIAKQILATFKVN